MTVKRDLDRFNKRLIAGIKNALTRGELTALGREAIKIIAARTRRGFGVAQAGGNQRKLKSLSSAYKEFRKRSSKLNRALTSPGKSNLTFTGQLLDSLRVVEVDQTRQSVFINANRRRRRGGATNQEVAEFVEEQGRQFLNLSKREIDKIAASYRRNLVANLKRDF